MATGGTKPDCKLDTISSLELKTEHTMEKVQPGTHTGQAETHSEDGDMSVICEAEPVSTYRYQGLVVSGDKIIVIDQNKYNVQIYGHDVKLIATSDKLATMPRGICLLKENKICVILIDGTIKIMSVQCAGDIVAIECIRSLKHNTKLTTFNAVTVFEDRLIICGKKGEKAMYWCPVTYDENVFPKLYKICDGNGWSNLTTSNNIIYIACYAGHLSSDNAVYSYNIANPEKQLAKYSHHDLHCPQGIAVDNKAFVFVINEGEPACIHHLTADLGQLKIYHEEMPLNPYSIFWCPQKRNLYLLSQDMEKISQYRPVYNSQQDEIPSSSTVMPPATSAVMASTKADTTTTATESQSLASNLLITPRTSTEVPTTSTTLAEPTTNDSATTTRGEDGSFFRRLIDCCCCRKKYATRYSQGVQLGYIRINHILYKKDVILASGSFGTIVYQGLFDGRDVAVKRMLLEHYTIVEREVNILQKADKDRQHPNIVRYFLTEKDSNFCYIALELCDGTLETFVKKTFLEQKVVTLLHQILSGLEHLHSLNIVHRDLKPKNILLSKQNDEGQVRAMISDLGLSRILNETTLSSDSDALGTFGWMAPEMWESFQKKEETKSKQWLTRAVDIFSGGCLMYYTFSRGSHPYGDDYSTRIVNMQSGDYNLDNLPETSDVELAKDIIGKMLSRAPKSRPSAEEVLHHPLFWNAKRKLDFIKDASDWINDIGKKNPTRVKLVEDLEEDGDRIVGHDWKNRISQELQEDIENDVKLKRRAYDGSKVEDLLRLIRNKSHHYWNKPELLKKSLGSPPEQFLEYFTSRFPLLIAHTYRVMQLCRKEHIFKTYYENK